MFRHALRLIWNRKRANALIILELMLAFLIVFFVAGMGAHLLHRWQQPLGFEWEDTLEVQLGMSSRWTEEDGIRLQNLLSTLRDQPEVEWAHTAIPPFRGWTWSTSVRNGDTTVHVNVNRFTDGAAEDFGVELLEGRFFDATDYSPDSEPVLIDERLAAQLFPDGFVPGTDIRDYDSDGEEEPSWPVVGVFQAFRQHGELSPIKEYVIGRHRIEDPEEDSPTIQVRVAKGTPVEFEERLQSLAEGEAPDWNISITPLAKLRARQIKERIIPLGTAACIALFLLAMVAFGLFGVLWQSVTRRTDELGLRRALGAHRKRVYRLIVTETLVIALFACVLGIVIAVQFPIAGSFPALDWRSAISGMGIGLASMMGLAGLCSLYPAWLAARRSPAEALHYE